MDISFVIFGFGTDSNIAMENGPRLKMYFLLKMGVIPLLC